MTQTQFVCFVLILALATALTRCLPFWIFDREASRPKIIDYLGKTLPAAMMGLLVVYCFKDLNFREMHELLPALCASACVVFLHLWKKNTMLSIAAGTAVYMVLIRIL